MHIAAIKIAQALCFWLLSCSSPPPVACVFWHVRCTSIAADIFVTPRLLAAGNQTASLLAQLAQAQQAQQAPQAPANPIAGLNLGALLGSSPALSPVTTQALPMGCCAPAPGGQETSTPKVCFFLLAVLVPTLRASPDITTVTFWCLPLHLLSKQPLHPSLVTACGPLSSSSDL